MLSPRPLRGVEVDINHLVRLRTERAMSRAQLAEAVKCSKSTIDKIEQRKALPSMAMLGKLAKALGVEPKELLPPEE